MIAMEPTPLPVKAKQTKKIVIIAACLIILISFFAVPWATNEWDPDLYGNNATELASRAPVLWIVPSGAVLAGLIALISNNTGRRPWIYWLLILLIAITMLYPLAWITNTLHIRQLTRTVEAGTNGMVFIPWDFGDAMSMVYQHPNDRVLAGYTDPGIGYYLSVLACFVIILFAILGIRQKPPIPAEEPPVSPTADGGM
jgi:ABC-type branched-subunit amino acid transport system permease subunit